MSNELGEKLEKVIMKEYWMTVERKPYPMFKGLWESRHALPTTHSYDFAEELNEHLEIPLQGGGYMKLGKTAGEKAEISVDLRFQTAGGETREASFIVTNKSTVKEGDTYPFWIFYDDDDQNERMKFLGRMKPEKDIDWEKIKPDTAEYKIAQALSKYKASDLPPKNFT